MRNLSIFYFIAMAFLPIIANTTNYHIKNHVDSNYQNLELTFVNDDRVIDKPAYLLYNGQGEHVRYYEMLEHCQRSDVILFGELHNNPISHWLQFELTKDLHDRIGEHLILGAEMLETDNQLLLDEYLQEIISERNFIAEAKLWHNYQTDYKPLVEFARENGLVFIATNIPRRYASLVHRRGFEALEELSLVAKSYIAPLPILYDAGLPAYQAMLDMADLPAHAGENLPKAQAIKDATMAHFINKNRTPNGPFIHFHGAYHSNHYEGITWYLRQLDETIDVVTISTVEQDDIQRFNPEHVGLADYIIVVAKTMTKTY
jgi:uncharacterized iron-regulated protein